MIHSSPHLLLFSSTLIMGTTISLSATQWIYVWLGLELNLLSFIPMITSFKSSQTAEGRIKYFLPQAIGSGLLLLGGIITTHSSILVSTNTSLLIILFALLLKLGVAPLHFWFPRVITNLSWPICLTLSTWQKVAPLLILIHLANSSFAPVLWVVRCLRALVGGVGGINQTHLRPLLAYSSIGHIGWVTAVAPVSYTTATLYFSTYLILITSIMYPLCLLPLNKANQASSLLTAPKTFTLIIIITLLSLGGLPPLTGFIPKLIALQTLTSQNQTILPLVLILGSLINLRYYLNLFFNLSLQSILTKPKEIKHNYPILPTIILATLSLSLIPLMLILTNLTI